MRICTVLRTIAPALFLLLEGGTANSDPASLEYSDTQYGFAFQYPAAWSLQTAVNFSALGQVRALVKHPTKPIYFAAVVGELGTSVSRAALAANPQSKQIVDAMAAFTVDEVYRKSAASQHLENMKIAETTEVASPVAVEFYIATFSTFQGTIVSMAGLHAVPFDRRYMISFIEVSPVDPAATEDNDLLRRTFNSFHLTGDQGVR